MQERNRQDTGKWLTKQEKKAKSKKIILYIQNLSSDDIET